MAIGPSARLSAVALLLGLACSVTATAAVEVDPAVERALERLYNFDFPAAHATLDAHRARRPEDPLGFSVRGAVYLFHELDRLGILAAEFFQDDDRVVGEGEPEADPAIKQSFLAALEEADRLALGRLQDDPRDPQALFALCLKEGLLTDYMVLIEKRGLASFRYAKAAGRHAQLLLEVEPEFADAHLAAGVNEYLLGNLPFFIRWFIRIEGVEGSKEQAFRKLEIVAERGRYLGPFARILMSIMALREDQPLRARALLAGLTRDYPENPLLRTEYERVNEAAVTANR
jgi:hypothetical protein